MSSRLNSTTVQSPYPQPTFLKVFREINIKNVSVTPPPPVFLYVRTLYFSIDSRPSFFFFNSHDPFLSTKDEERHPPGPRLLPPSVFSPQFLEPPPPRYCLPFQSCFFQRRPPAFNLTTLILPSKQIRQFSELWFLRFL